MGGHRITVKCRCGTAGRSICAVGRWIGICSVVVCTIPMILLV